MRNYFQDETEDTLRGWDGLIKMESVPDKLDWSKLTEPLPCGDGYVPNGFAWNGASVGPLRSLPIIGFPKWRHPIATCRHDWRCQLAKTRHERRIADKLFKRDIGLGQSNKILGWWEQTKGYIGVRIGAIFGVGVNHQ